MKKTIAFLMVGALLCALLLGGCGKIGTDSGTTTLVAAGDSADAYTSKYDGTHPQVTFTMQENGEIIAGSFTMELYPEYAPHSVDNFMQLVEDGFYDGLTFHRVMDGFMAQGGDPTLSGRPDSAPTVPGEFASNGFSRNTLSHTRGVVSMARTNDPNSGSSQFFICYDDATFLDGNYAAFGKVIDGMEVVDSFLDAQRTTNMGGELATPVTPIVIESAVVAQG